MKLKSVYVLLVLVVLCLPAVLAQYNSGITCWKCPVCGYTASITPYQLATANPYNLCPVCYSAYAFQFVQIPCQDTTGYSQTGYNEPIDGGAASSSSTSPMPRVDSRPAIENGQGPGSDTAYGTVDQQTAQDWLNKGNNLASQGKYDEAIQAYEKVIDIYPNAAAWSNKGVALQYIGKYDEAIKAFDEALKISPRDADILNYKGGTLHSQGKALEDADKDIEAQNKYDKAIEIFEEALRINPENAYVWFNKGLTLADQEKYDEAISAFDKAIKFKPDYIEAFNEKGSALIDQYKYDEAIQAFDEALRINPNYEYAIENKKIAIELRDSDTAIEDIIASIGSNMSLSSLRSEYGEVESSVNSQSGIGIEKNAGSNTSYGLTEQQTAQDWLDEGNALIDQFKFDEAIRPFDEAIRLDPNNAVAWNKKGFCLSWSGKYEEAIKAFDEAIRLDPEYALAWYNKGDALEQLGKNDEANKAFGEASRLDPEYAML